QPPFFFQMCRKVLQKGRPGFFPKGSSHFHLFCYCFACSLIEVRNTLDPSESQQRVSRYSRTNSSFKPHLHISVENAVIEGPVFAIILPFYHSIVTYGCLWLPVVPLNQPGVLDDGGGDRALPHTG